MGGALFVDEAGHDAAGLAANRRTGELARMEWATAGGFESYWRRGRGVRTDGLASAAAEPDCDSGWGRSVGSLTHAGRGQRFFPRNVRSRAMGTWRFSAEFVSAAA